MGEQEKLLAGLSRVLRVMESARHPRNGNLMSIWEDDVKDIAAVEQYLTAGLTRPEVLTAEAIEAGAQALVNDHWHPPQKLSSINRSEADRWRKQARLVLEAAMKSAPQVRTSQQAEMQPNGDTAGCGAGTAAQTALKLGDLVCMAKGTPFYHDWRGVEMKIVSLRIEPDGKQWASVIDKPYGQHRGYGYYDGETTEIDCAHLEKASSVPSESSPAQASSRPTIDRNSPAPDPCAGLSVAELIEWLDSPQYTNGFLDFDAVNHMSAAAELLDKLFPEALALPSASSPVQAPLTVGVLHDIFITMRHARTFITSREKMHPTGVELWDKLFAQIEELHASSVPSASRGTEA